MLDVRDVHNSTKQDSIPVVKVADKLALLNLGCGSATK